MPSLFAALFAALLPAAAPAAPTPAPVPATVLFGDSLMYAAQDEYRQFPGTTDDVIWAYPGWWLPYLADLMVATGELEPPPRTVVIALGTNDATFSDQAWTASRWDYVLDQLELQGVCVVSLDYRKTRLVDVTFAFHMNPVWAEHTEVHRINWEAYANANPGIHGPDGIHHNQTGQNAYAYTLWLARQVCPA